MASSVVHQQWSTLSSELAQAAERAGGSVVCIHAGHRHASSGVVWQKGVLVASSGVISGLMGPWRSWRGGEIDQFVRPDLILYPGFSGGPLVNSAEQVLGINTSGLRRGVPLTIPSSTVTRIVHELVERGRIARPYLGLAMQSVVLPPELRNKLN